MSDPGQVWIKFVQAIQDRILNPGPLSDNNVKYWSGRMKAALRDEEVQ